MHDPIVYHGLIWFLLVGGLSGWLASVLVTGGGMGILADIAVGILGAFVGGFLAGVFGINVYGFGGYLGLSILGAVILLAIFRGFTSRRRTA